MKVYRIPFIRVFKDGRFTINLIPFMAIAIFGMIAYGSWSYDGSTFMQCTLLFIALMGIFPLCNVITYFAERFCEDVEVKTLFIEM